MDPVEMAYTAICDGGYEIFDDDAPSRWRPASGGVRQPRTDHYGRGVVVEKIS